MGIQNNHTLQVTHIFHYLGGAGDTALVIKGCDTKKARLTLIPYHRTIYFLLSRTLVCMVRRVRDNAMVGNEPYVLYGTIGKTNNMQQSMRSLINK